MPLNRLHKATLTIALGVLPAAASAQLVNFGLLDVSEDTRTLALVRALQDNRPERPDPLLTANYTRWQTGSSTGVGYMHRWALTSGRAHSWGVGLGVGLNHFESRDGDDNSDTDGSLRAQTELSGPAPGGSYFALLQASTFRSSIFALAQYNIANSRVGFDISRYRETGVNQTAIALRVALDSQKRWFFRTGVVDTADETQPFIGIAYNAF